MRLRAKLYVIFSAAFLMMMGVLFVSSYIFLGEGLGSEYTGYDGVQVFGAFLLFGVLFTVLTEKLVDRHIITRLEKLSKDIDGIDSGSLDYYSIIDEGDDEIHDISRKINDLLKTLHIYRGQLKKSERMVTIGETATMVGHDLRNPLQVAFILNAKLQMIVKELHAQGLEGPQLEELQYVSDKLDEETRYMNKIVSDLQDYAKKMVVSMQDTDMEKLIVTMVSDLNIPTDIDVKVEFEAGFPVIRVDPSLTKRVYTNLILNAIQAMPDGGRLSFTGGTANDYVYLSVEDTGVGISAEDMKSIFRPLYTTKAKGTGFGLPVCKRILDAHGADITVESSVGEGTTVTVFFPIYSMDVAQGVAEVLVK